MITESYCSGTSTSSTVYTTGVPFVEFLSNPSQVLAHPFDSSSVTGSPKASPSAVNCTLIESGLYPSWSLLSFQTFNTSTFTNSFSCLLVMSISVLPVVWSTCITGVCCSYSSERLISSTEYSITSPAALLFNPVQVYVQLSPDNVCVAVIPS